MGSLRALPEAHTPLLFRLSGLPQRKVRCEEREATGPGMGGAAMSPLRPLHGEQLNSRSGPVSLDGLPADGCVSPFPGSGAPRPGSAQGAPRPRSSDYVWPTIASPRNTRACGHTHIVHHVARRTSARSRGLRPLAVGFESGLSPLPRAFAVENSRVLTVEVDAVCARQSASARGLLSRVADGVRLLGTEARRVPFAHRSVDPARCVGATRSAFPNPGVLASSARFCTRGSTLPGLSRARAATGGSPRGAPQPQQAAREVTRGGVAGGPCVCPVSRIAGATRPHHVGRCLPFRVRAVRVPEDTPPLGRAFIGSARHQRRRRATARRALLCTGSP